MQEMAINLGTVLNGSFAEYRKWKDKLKIKMFKILFMRYNQFTTLIPIKNSFLLLRLISWSLFFCSTFLFKLCDSSSFLYSYFECIQNNKISHQPIQIPICIKAIEHFKKTMSECTDCHRDQPLKPAKNYFNQKSNSQNQN